MSISQLVFRLYVFIEKRFFGLFRFIVGFIKSIEHTQMFVEFKKGENLAAAGDGVVFAVDDRGNV